MWDNVKYFQSWEFDSPDLPGSGDLMSLEFVLRLDAARDKAGIPFYINSGFRSAPHNERIGGVENSSHLNGLAADIRAISGLEKILIVKSLIQEGFTRIGIGRNFIHVDSDCSKADSLWTYNGLCKDMCVVLPSHTVSPQLTKNGQSLDWSHTLYDVSKLHSAGYQGEGVRVAVLDTGLDLSHESFQSAIAEGRLKSIDARTGVNQPIDRNGHGTWCVSRFISDGKNALGYAPKCSVTSFKVLNDNGSGSLLNVIRGVELALAEGVDIISTSIGWPSRYAPFDAVVRKVKNSGVLWFSASGNDGKNEDIDYPGLYDDIFSCGSHDKNFKRSSFSDYGVDLDLYGPGQQVKAAYLNNTEAFLSGTSMATPTIAALIASIYEMLKTKNGKITREVLKNIAVCK